MRDHRVAGAIAAALVGGAFVFGCGNGGRVNKGTATGTPTSGGTTGTTTQTTSGTPETQVAPQTPPPPTGNVGSPFWYVGDQFGGPFKTHNPSEATQVADVLSLVNQERAANNLPPLLQDAQAERAAKVHAEDMFGRNFFSHVTPEGWTVGDRVVMTGGSGFSTVGENIALGFSSATAVVNAWLNSPGHRANILSPNYTHLGVGFREGSNHWVQVFLRRP